MSDFLDYYKNAEQKRAITEEEKLELHKKHKLISARRHQLEEADTFYTGDDDDITINEGKRIYKRPVRMPVRTAPAPAPLPRPNPAPRPVPAPAPAPRPAPAPKPAPAPAPAPVIPDDFETPAAPVRDPFDEVIPSGIPAPKKRRIRTIDESTNSALKEAYSMMDEMQHKIETMFYRYGMAGLEKINECMEEVFENIVNPKPVEPEIKYIEKPVVVQKPKKKIVKKTTITETTTSEPKVKTKKPAEMTPEKVQQAFEDINNSFDVAQIGTSLSEANNSLNKSESIAAKTMKKVQAQAMMLEQAMNKKNESSTQEAEENYVQPEEIDIVDDDVVDDPIAEAKNYDDVEITDDGHTANISDLPSTASDEK